MRGELTKNVIVKSKELLGYEIDTVELRLMPYIQYTMMNNQSIDPNSINAEDRKVLSKWRKSGHIEGGVSGLAITKEFWDIINELLFMSYVCRENT